MAKSELNDKRLVAFSFKVSLELNEVVDAEQASFDLIQNLLVVFEACLVKVVAQVVGGAYMGREPCVRCCTVGGILSLVRFYGAHVRRVGCSEVVSVSYRESDVQILLVSR